MRWVLGDDIDAKPGIWDPTPQPNDARGRLIASCEDATKEEIEALLMACETRKALYAMCGAVRAMGTAPVTLDQAKIIVEAYEQAKAALGEP